MIYLGLGSNIEDKLNYIISAVKKISKLKGTNILRSSSFYRTEPWGIISQEEFINSIVEIESTLTPGKLFKEIKKIETDLGRKKRKKWHEREIDIDILFYNDEIINTRELTIPHPEIQNRKFVLIPMCELNPALVHPVLNSSLEDLLNNTKDNSKVKKILIR